MHLGERLTEFVDGRLDATAAAEVERHLEQCAACRADLDSLRATLSLIRRADTPGPRAAFWHRLEVRLAEERRRRRQRWFSRLLIPAAIAAALAAALAAVPVGSVALPVEGFVHEHARYLTLHPLADQAVITLVSTDASLRLDPRIFP
ncbi:MAG: zf-HC2 domain-containing protein [Armatimonadota bacterium]|nr:zf-HC2 domain-containing protein [Armatimonadota bacterium]MDR7535121.1 zf-HC2 domain-containing protein [Armatimonadota bacterium]